MNMKIQQKYYNLNTSAVTCIRYRAMYNTSIIEDLKQAKKYDNFDILVALFQRIVYIAIENKNKCTFEYFKKITRADLKFFKSALFFLSELFKSSKKTSKNQKEVNETEDKFDEFKLVSLSAECNIPEFLLQELSIFQILEIINLQLEMKNPSTDKKYRKMSNKEMLALYG